MLLRIYLYMHRFRRGTCGEFHRLLCTLQPLIGSSYFAYFARYNLQTLTPRGHAQQDIGNLQDLHLQFTLAQSRAAELARIFGEGSDPGAEMEKEKAAARGEAKSEQKGSRSRVGTTR